MYSIVVNIIYIYTFHIMSQILLYITLIITVPVSIDGGYESSSKSNPENAVLAGIQAESEFPKSFIDPNDDIDSLPYEFSAPASDHLYYTRSAYQSILFSNSKQNNQYIRAPPVVS